MAKYLFRHVLHYLVLQGNRGEIREYDPIISPIVASTLCFVDEGGDMDDTNHRCNAVLHTEGALLQFGGDVVLQVVGASGGGSTTKVEVLEVMVAMKAMVIGTT
ncbi:uncharacterized protein LOC111404990 [Olea europaea var. sylvestris]|uniref:uncharacterized protein LOC111404990 n=1 Tax=Olea europaea var. sylvestris TaxID=158386 RepID=UPI000C1CDDF3|nr:uncharacterized protein LOC111404990 [Olea europaea var. sylvestris]